MRYTKFCAILGVVILGVLLWRSLASQGAPLEAGYIDSRHMEEIDRLERTADRRIDCDGLDLIDIGLSKVRDDFVRDPLYLRRQQVRFFLHNETHKELLIVHINRPVGLPSVQSGFQPFNDLSMFFDEFGYKRILYLSPCCEGTFVIRDVIRKSRKTSLLK